MLPDIKNILSVLDPGERKNFFRLAAYDTIVSLLDISFLAAMLVVINFYTSHTYPAQLPYRKFFEQLPFLLIVVFFLLFSIKNVFAYLLVRMQYRFVYNVASRLSAEKLDRFLHGSFRDYTHVDSAVHVRRISQQPVEFGHYILRGAQVIITQSVLILFTVTAIMLYSTLLFSLLLLILVPPVCLLSVLFKKRLRETRLAGKKASERSLQYLKEALNAYVESNIYNRHNFFSERYQKSQTTLNNFLSEQQVIQNLPSRLIEVFAVFGLLVLVLLRSYLPGDGSLDIITLGAFMAAAYKIIPGIVKIINCSSQINTYSYTISDLLHPAADNNILKSHCSIYNVEYDRISFAHNGTMLMKDFCLKINKGQFICIQGRSASGKSTLLNLLLGFLQPQKGNVYINTNDIADNIKQYWPVISYVKQQPFFVHDSILKNITLEENAQDDPRLSEVLAVTGIDHWLKDTHDGIHSVISEDGKNISGGQRQRIMLARALYKDFDMLLLDEPFSELDTESETCMMKYLRKIANNGKTVIMIAHDRRLADYCDKTISLEET